MNYERMLVSPVVPTNYRVYLNVLQRLSVCYTQLRGTVGEWGEVGREGRCSVGVSVRVVSVGFQLRTPRREGKDLLGNVGAVCGLREKRGQRLRAALRWRVTDKMFSKCRVICGGRFWV